MKSGFHITRWQNFIMLKPKTGDRSVLPTVDIYQAANTKLLWRHNNLTYTTHSTCVSDLVCILVLALCMEHTPAIRACKHFTGSMALKTIPVMTIIVLHKIKNVCFFGILLNFQLYFSDFMARDH